MKVTLEIPSDVLKRNSTSENGSIISSFSHCSGRSSGTKSLTNSNLRENRGLKKGFQKVLQKLSDTRDWGLRKVVQTLLKVTIVIDSRRTHDVMEVSFPPAEEKNVKNEQLNVRAARPYLIAQCDKTMGICGTEDENLHDKTLETDLRTQDVIQIKESLLENYSMRNKVLNDLVEPAVFDTDHTDNTFQDELEQWTRKMFDFDIEEKEWLYDRIRSQIDEEEDTLQENMENCSEIQGLTMEENENLENERFYELKSNQIEEDGALQELDNRTVTMEEREIAERERLYELQSNQIEEEDALPKKLDNCDEKREWTVEESEIAERERLYDLQSNQIEEEDALPKKLDNCDEKREWTVEESEIAERERLYDLQSNQIEEEDALPKKLDNCDERREWTMEESEIAERERLYEMQSYQIEEDTLAKNLENCEEKLEWTMEESEIEERERLYEIMSSQFEELDAFTDGSEEPLRRERGGHKVMMSNTRDDRKEMNIGLRTNPQEDRKSMIDKFHTDKKDNTYECDEKAGYEKESGKDAKRAGCDGGALRADVKDVDQTSSGAGSDKDEAENIAREIVNGTSRHEYAKMEDVVEKWQELAKECNRELVGEQVSQTKLQDDKCQRGYDGDALETEERTYGRDVGGMEQEGCDKGMNKAEDEYKGSAFGKDSPQKEEHGPTRKTARADKRSRPRRLDNFRNMAKSQDDDYQNQQVQNDGIISSMPHKKELPDTMTHVRSSEIPNLHYNNVALGSSEKRTNVNATKQAKRASKKRSRRKRPRSPPCCSGEGYCCSAMRDADNLMTEPTLLKTMAPDERDKWFQLLATLISRLLPCQQEARQSCKSTFVRKPRQTGDDVQRCKLPAGILLDHAGDSQETIRTKDEILHKIGNNPNNPKALHYLAASHFKGTLKTFQLEQLTTGKRPEQAAESVVREFNHQGLTIGHLVKYFNDDCTCRDDILRLIDKIHPNCVYCCPERSCK